MNHNSPSYQLRYYLANQDKYKGYRQKYYLAHKAELNRRATLRKQNNRNKLRKLINGIKAGKACLDCNQVFPCYVLHFDHRDPVEKFMDISEMLTHAYSEKKVFNEIAKCDLVCANCHAIRTHNRRVDVQK